MSVIKGPNLMLEFSYSFKPRDDVHMKKALMSY